MPHRERIMAPGLERLLAQPSQSRTSLWVPPTLRSVRGIERVSSLEVISLPSGVGLGPVARLPRLHSLSIEGAFQATRRVRLAPLAHAPALVSLLLYNLSTRIEDIEALAAISALRAVEICGGDVRCPDLRPLAGTGLQRLVLDGVAGVYPRWLAGLPVTTLDLWGCGLEDLAVLATLPHLKEVWLQGNRVRSLKPLLHLSAGARVFLDADVDPTPHREDIAALEARGVWLMIAADPSEHGIHPPWWGSGGAPLPVAERSPIRYQSATLAPG